MPAVDSPETQLQVETSSSPQGRRRGILLVVDDEEGPRQSARFIFKDEYEVKLAEDGPRAVELVQKERVDVALIDIRMGAMSGIELLERLKFVDPCIEVVMMTAFETTDTIRQALRLRACDYVNKPFDIPALRQIIGGAMQRRLLEGEPLSTTDKVQELLNELNQQKLEEQMSKTRGEIYGSILHDMNGPLTVISGFAQLMTQRLGDATELRGADLDFVRERLQTINRQVTNCMDISRRYLSFLRRESNDAPRVGINQLLSDLTHLIRVHPSLLQNDFKVIPAPQDIGLRMNGTDVIQLLLNLCVNGFQCSPSPHSVTVSTSLFEQALDLSRFRDGPLERFLNVEKFENIAPVLAISVADTGPGVPLEILPKIFQTYFTTKGPRQGTGLGLSIVQRLVKENAGALHLKTQPGQGTTFTAYLRAAPISAV